jgi:hypothetical protein
VDIEATTDAGGGYDVGWIAAREWLKYTVTVTAPGTYTVDARVASNGPGGTFHLEFDGVPISSALTIPNTGGWQQWTDVVTAVTLPGGTHILRVVFDTIGASGTVGNLNYLAFTNGSSSSSTPFGGTPRPIPGQIEAEDFDDGGQSVAYADTTAGNYGGQYRNTDVDIEPTTEIGGGYDVGWIAAGEWLNYTVNVASAGTYMLSVRVACSGPGGTIHVEANGTKISGTLTIPDTGGWQNWTGR